MRRKEAQGGRRGKAEMRQCPAQAGRRENRHSDGRQARNGRGSLSSRRHKLERMRVAAAGIRKGYMRREGRCSQVRQKLKPEDFGARALLRANGMFPIVDRRSSGVPANRSPFVGCSSVNRGSCGRRTSLGRRELGNSAAPALPISIASIQAFLQVRCQTRHPVLLGHLRDCIR